ncbi:MAG: rod shape-determining protein MreC [Firmicutes bacterium]|nr:rod shape-determining protein MreC [Bacillota bacterium]
MNPSVWRVVAILGVGVILLALSLVFFTGEDLAHVNLVKDTFLTGFSQVQGFVARLGASTAGFFQGIFDFRNLQEENKELRKELAERENLRHQILELQKENYRLRGMLDFKERTEYELLPAEVIARDPSNWFETITVNRGALHGVKKNMPVITSQGLVGNILKVSRTSSRVLLLTDSRRAVSALVMRSREPGDVGIVEGSSGESASLRMTNLPPEANIQPGDTVISSGLGGIFPKGLVIGTVLETGLDQYGLLQQAVVLPAVNFNRLEEVFIVMDFPHENEEQEAEGHENEG